MPDYSVRSDQDNQRRSSSEEDGISLLTVSSVLLRRRRFILGIAAGLALVIAVTRLVRPPKYTVTSAFIIQKRDQSAAAGLAAQFGVDVAGTDPSQSPVLYSSLVKQPDMLGHLVDSTFSTSDDPQPRTLSAIWEIDERNPVLRRDRTLLKLTDAISSGVGLKVEVVTLDITTADPLLSAELSTALLAQVNRFNFGTRQSQATAERRFTEQRLHDVEREMRRVEDSVQTFLQRNRQSLLSPELELDKQRLTRRSDQLHATFTTLATAFERARIDEVRDTPALTIVRRPVAPVRPNSRGVITGTILGLVLGMGLGAMLALLRELFKVLRTSNDSHAREFIRLLDETSNDVRRLRPHLSRKSKQQHNTKSA